MKDRLSFRTTEVTPFSRRLLESVDDYSGTTRYAIDLLGWTSHPVLLIAHKSGVTLFDPIEVFAAFLMARRRSRKQPRRPGGPSLWRSVPPKPPAPCRLRILYAFRCLWYSPYLTPSGSPRRCGTPSAQASTGRNNPYGRMSRRRSPHRLRRLTPNSKPVPRNRSSPRKPLLLHAVA